MWHQPYQCCKYTTSVDIKNKNAIKGVTHVEPHVSAVSLLKRVENSTIYHQSKKKKKKATKAKKNHWCLARAQPFAGTCRFLDGRSLLSTSWELSGSNWFRTIILTMKKQKTLFSALSSIMNLILSCKMWSVPQHMQMSSGKLVLQSETDVGNELLLRYYWPRLMLLTLA